MPPRIRACPPSVPVRHLGAEVALVPCSKKVLVVDDQPEIRAVAARWLAREGFDVEVAESGEEALSAVSRQAPDLVCLDIELPGMSGTEALKRLLAMCPGLPVIVLSGYSDEATGSDVARLGAAGFVGKPFNRQRLGEAVRAVIEPTLESVFGSRQT